MINIPFLSHKTYTYEDMLLTWTWLTLAGQWNRTLYVLGFHDVEPPSAARQLLVCECGSLWHMRRCFSPHKVFKIFGKNRKGGNAAGAQIKPFYLTNCFEAKIASGCSSFHQIWLRS